MGRYITTATIGTKIAKKKLPMEALEKWLKGILLSQDDDSYNSKQCTMTITWLVSQHRRLFIARNQQKLKAFNDTTYSLPICVYFLGNIFDELGLGKLNQF